MKIKLTHLLVILVLSFFAYTGIITLFYITNADKKSNKISFSGVSKDALERYSGGLKIKTISKANYKETNFEEFEKFICYLKKTYPVIFKKTEFTRINKYALVFKINGKNKELKPNILTAHYDVVDGGKEENWIHPPFSGYYDENYIYSRGTLDDKSSFFAILEATNELLKENFVPEADLYLAFSHTEETGSPEGAKKIIEYFKEKNIHFSTALDEGGRVVDKNANYYAFVGTAEKGRLLTKITVYGKGKHASTPDKNLATNKLAKLILAFNKSSYKTELSKDMLQYYLKTFNGYNLKTRYLLANRNIFKHLLLKELSKNPEDNARINTTFAISIIEASNTANVIAGEASMIIDSRILPTHKIEDIKKYIENLAHKTLPNEEIKIEYLSELTPCEASKTDTEDYKLLKKNINQLFPIITIAPYLVLGATDAREYAEIADNTYRFLPIILTEEEAGLMHADNERISVENWTRMIYFYREFIKSR